MRAVALLRVGEPEGLVVVEEVPFFEELVGEPVVEGPVEVGEVEPELVE